MAEGAGLVSDGQTSPSIRSPETSELTQTGDALPGATMTSYSPLRALHQPCCWVLLLILLVLSLLFSWAVVHLSLGARNKPFRISSSYNQPGDMETATYDPRFTTNCTISKCFWKYIFETSRNWKVFFLWFDVSLKVWICTPKSKVKFKINDKKSLLFEFISLLFISLFYFYFFPPTIPIKSLESFIFVYYYYYFKEVFRLKKAAFVWSHILF